MEDLAVLLITQCVRQRRIEQRRALAHHCALGLGHGEHLAHGWYSPDQHVTDSEALLE